MLSYVCHLSGVSYVVKSVAPSVSIVDAIARTFKLREAMLAAQLLQNLTHTNTSIIERLILRSLKSCTYLQFC